MCVGCFDSRQNHIYPFDGKLRTTLHLVFKPLAERFDLLLRVRREQMLDGHVGRRDKDRFRMRQSIEAGLAVVVADARESDAAERHGFDKQMDVHLINGAAAEGQGRKKMIDRLLVTAEEETGKGLRTLLHLTNGGIHTLIGKDWEEPSEDFVLHDRIVAGNGINALGIDVASLRVGFTASDDFALADKRCNTFDRRGTYDQVAGAGSALR